MADAVLAIKIVTDYASAQKGLDATGGKVSKMQAGLGKLAAPAAGAALAIAAFGKSAVDAASRTQQALGAVDSVFGKNAGQIKRWAAGAADSAGLAKSEYMELASVIGAQLKNMGVPLDEVAGKTNDLVKMGADLAATYGGTTKEAVEALGSALRGETDPIERYGVSVKQADIAAKMAADGTDKLTGKAAKQAKTAALLALVTKQSADAQGQFARESDSAAGQAQIAAANFENMQSELGTALLPAVTAVMEKLAGLARLMAKHKTITLVVIGVIAALAVAILALNVALGIYTAVTTLAGSATLAAWIAAAWPILAVVAAVALVVAGIVILWKKSKTFRAIVIGTWNGIKAAALAVARATKAAWTAVWGALKTAARATANAIKTAWNAVKSAARATVSAVRGFFVGLWNSLKTGVRAAIAVVKAAIQGVKSVASSVANTIRNIFAGVWSALKSGARSVGDALRAPFDAVRNAAETAISWIQKVIDKIRSIPSPSKLLDKIPGVGKAAPAMAPVAGYTAPTGRSGRLVGVGVTAAAATSGGPTIIVQGAIDPEATARQIRRILSGHERRTGLR